MSLIECIVSFTKSPSGFLRAPKALDELIKQSKEVRDIELVGRQRLSMEFTGSKTVQLKLDSSVAAPREGTSAALFPDHDIESLLINDGGIDRNGNAWSIIEKQSSKNKIELVSDSSSSQQKITITSNQYKKLKSQKTNSYSLRVNFDDGTTHVIEVSIPELFKVENIAGENVGRINLSKEHIEELVSELPLATIKTIDRLEFSPTTLSKFELKIISRSIGFDLSKGASGSAIDQSITIFPNKTSLEHIKKTVRHELGHTIANYIWNSPEPPKNIWNKAIKMDGNSVSKYGDVDDSEDFAEAVMKYLDYNEKGRLSEFRDLHPNRAKVLDGILGDTSSLDKVASNFIREYYTMPHRLKSAFNYGLTGIAITGTGLYWIKKINTKDSKKK